MVIGDGDTCESHLDVDTFPYFAPFLRATHEYAALSGCRYRASSFDGFDEKAEAADASCGARTDRPSETRASTELVARNAAKVDAVPAVRLFRERLRAKDPLLLEELARASSITVAESVRNAVVATCRRLSLWPPLPPPVGIDESDCAYEDMSAPLRAIAQRAYNDEARRIRCQGGASGTNALVRRALTASYLVDFAQQSGTPLPPVPSTFEEMFDEFMARAADCEAAERSSSNSINSRKSDSRFLSGVRNFRTRKRGSDMTLYSGTRHVGSSPSLNVGARGDSRSSRSTDHGQPLSARTSAPLLHGLDKFRSEARLFFARGQTSVGGGGGGGGGGGTFPTPRRLWSSSSSTSVETRAEIALDGSGVKNEVPMWRLKVEVLEASDLAAPECRDGDAFGKFLHGESLRGPECLHAYVEVSLGNQNVCTANGKNRSPSGDSVDFKRECILLDFGAEHELLVRVRDRRRMQVFFRGDPLIGEITLPLGPEIRDGEPRVLHLPLSRQGGHTGVVTLRIRALLAMSQSEAEARAVGPLDTSPIQGRR